MAEILAKNPEFRDTMMPTMASLFDWFFISGTQEIVPLQKRMRLVFLTLISLVGAFACLCFGLGELAGVFPFGDSGGPAIAPIVDLTYAALFFGLFVFVRFRKSLVPGSVALLVLAASLFLFEFVSGGTERAGTVWVVAFPLVSVLVAGYLNGLILSSAFGVLCVFSGASALFGVPDYPEGFGIRLAAVYVIVSIASLMIQKMFETILANYEGVKARLDTAERRQSSLYGKFVADYRAGRPDGENPEDGLILGFGQDRKSEGSEGMAGYERLFGILGGIAESKDDVFVLYRKDVLNTLSSIPSPDAVFSYVMLEGLGNLELFGVGEASGAVTCVDSGDFICSSFGVDDLFSKAESIIEFREVKKEMEFNKIQSQIDRIFSHDSESDSGSGIFERVCQQYSISEREVDVARCILKGLTNKEISKELFISFETVKTHVKNILKKCGINSRIDFINLFSSGRS